MVRPFLTAEWRHLVFLNYEVDPLVLKRFLPHGLELDLWHGQCFASIVGFMFYSTKLAGWPIPFHRTFPEVNLRFYVTREMGSDKRRGVVFIREVAPRRAVCWVARSIYNEQYCYRPMKAEIRAAHGDIGRIEYSWRSSGQQFAVDAEFTEQLEAPEKSSLAKFIIEHYWAYTRQRNGRVKEYQVVHRPWHIWPTKAHTVVGDFSRFYGSEFANMFNNSPVSAFVADGSPVEVYPGHLI